MRLSGNEIKAKADEKVYNAKGAFSSWKAFQAWVQVPSTALDQVWQSVLYIEVPYTDLYRSMATLEQALRGRTRILIPRHMRSVLGGGGIVSMNLGRMWALLMVSCRCNILLGSLVW